MAVTDVRMSIPARMHILFLVSVVPDSDRSLNWNFSANHRGYKAPPFLVIKLQLADPSTIAASGIVNSSKL